MINANLNINGARKSSPFPTADWYVRPSGGSYGTEDGASYDNAWNGFSNIVWGEGGVMAGDTLCVCGTHNETLTIGNDGVDGDPIVIRGDYTGDVGVIDSEDTRITGIDMNDKDFITLTSISSINATTQCLMIDGNSSNIITNSCTFSGSGNQGIQHLQNGSATHNDVTCTGNADDGISGHDDATIVINTGVITGNDQGINVIHSVKCTANNITFGSNTTYDLWATFADSQESAKITISNSIIKQNCLADENGRIDFTNCVIDADVNYGVASISAGYGVAINSRFVGKIRPLFGSEITFNRCLFDGSGVSADHIVDNNSSTVSLAYCVFKNIPSGKFGFANRTGATGVVNYCTFYGVSNVGDGIFSQANITINNNILYGLGRALLQLSGTFISNNSSFYENTTDITGTITNNNPQSGDPDLVDPNNEDYSLGASSTIIGDGINVVGFDTGIDTANWGNATTVPVITTKEQSESKDIGAYVS